MSPGRAEAPDRLVPQHDAATLRIAQIGPQISPAPVVPPPSAPVTATEPASPVPGQPPSIGPQRLPAARSIAPVPAPVAVPVPAAIPDPAPPPALARPADDHFSRRDVLQGTVGDETACAAIKTAVWVTGFGASECIRYYYSTAGGTGSRVLLFVNGDFSYRGKDGQPTVDPDYDLLAPADIQRIADVRSRDYGGPMIYLARPGTFGSSGNELQVRHTPREVALISAAVSEIKRRHKIATFDVVGHSGGGLLVGAMISGRSDIGCAATSSGVLATNDWVSQRLNIPASHDSSLYDPIDHVAEIHPGPEFRFFVLTDPLDLKVSPQTTHAYLDALQAQGIAYRQLQLTAADDAHHDLALHAFRAVIACAHGAADADIADLLDKTVVTDRHMSERSPIGPMPKTLRRSSSAITVSPQLRTERQAARVDPVAETTNDETDTGTGPKSRSGGGGRTQQPSKQKVPQPQTSQPRTSQPQTFQPQTSQPQALPPRAPQSPTPQPDEPPAQSPPRTEVQQDAVPPPAPTGERFSNRDLLAGTPVSMADCGRTAPAVLVVVDQHAECIRYYASSKLFSVRDAVVYFPWDEIITAEGHKPLPRGGYEDVVPSGLTETAAMLADSLQRPFLFMARPGTLGSSGRALDVQHTEREVRVMLAALDAVKRRLGIEKLHLVGQGGGGLLVAAAAEARSDVGCAVIASGFLSVKDGYRQGIYGPVATNQDLLFDPIEHLGDLSKSTARLIALQDPDDRISPHALQDDFVEAVKAAKIPILALRAGANDDNHHDLSLHGLRAAFACLQGHTDQEIAEFVARTPSSNPTEPHDTAKPAMPMPMPMMHDEVPTMSATEEMHFSSAELVSGKRADRRECETVSGGIWLVVDGRGDCIRYYYSEAGGKKPTALVFMNGDMVVTGGPDDMLAARPGYDMERPSELLKVAAAWSQAYGGPAIYLARPGTFGSSGREIVDRRTNREVALIAAALDEIRRRHGLTSFDITGQSGGGHLVAAMLEKRNDLRCATVSSGVLAVRDNEELRGRIHRPSDFDRVFDPILHVKEILDRPEQRIFILNDPQDKVVEPKSTEHFLKALAARGVPFQHIEAMAGDGEHHGLAIHGLRATIACAHGQTDAAIAKLVAETVVTHPMMSEMGTMGDMDAPQSK